MGVRAAGSPAMWYICVWYTLSETACPLRSDSVNIMARKSPGAPLEVNRAATPWPCFRDRTFPSVDAWWKLSRTFRFHNGVTTVLHKWLLTWLLCSRSSKAVISGPLTTCRQSERIRIHYLYTTYKWNILSSYSSIVEVYYVGPANPDGSRVWHSPTSHLHWYLIDLKQLYNTRVLEPTRHISSKTVLYLNDAAKRLRIHGIVVDCTQACQRISHPETANDMCSN